MRKDLDEQIRQAVETVKRKEKIRIHLDQLEDLLKERRHEKELLEAILKKEEDDFIKINNPGLRRVFQHFLGNLDATVDKERQEYLMAYLKHQHSVATIEDIQKECELLDNIWSGLYLAEKNLEGLLERKKIAIPLNNPELSKLLGDFDLKIFGLFTKKREIKEAIDAGNKSITQLKKIKGELARVKDWGGIDYHGIGQQATTKKKQFIDKANGDVLKADSLLLQFQKELFDISKHYNITYKHEIHVLQDFLDFYFNALIIDWVLKKKINNSIQGIDATIDSIDMTLRTLEHEKNKTRDIIEEHKQQKKDLMMKDL